MQLKFIQNDRPKSNHQLFVSWSIRMRSANPS